MTRTTRMTVARLIAIGLAGLSVLTTVALAEDATDEIARFRQQMADDNPAELWEVRGEEAWHEAAGPKHVSLEKCDLGLGAGVVAGSFAELPRWFADAGQVMDMEQRLVWCMVTLQGMSREAAEENHFGEGGRRSRLEALSAWVAGKSRGLPVKVPASHPEEQRMLALGERMFYYRAGRHDFSCATCHSGDKQRVRLQVVPNLTNPSDAQRAWTTWPAYRISQGEVRTMQNRMNDCLRQQRMPEVGFGSELVTALSMYMAHQAQGGIVDAPSLKR